MSDARMSKLSYWWSAGLLMPLISLSFVTAFYNNGGRVVC